jgi:hypothetical protein
MSKLEIPSGVVWTLVEHIDDLVVEFRSAEEVIDK